MTGPKGDTAPEFQPIGPKVEKPKPEKPEYTPTDTPGIEKNSRGWLRTNLPLPKL
jgi:hypothetical protein